MFSTFGRTFVFIALSSLILKEEGGGTVFVIVLGLSGVLAIIEEWLADRGNRE